MKKVLMMVAVAVMLFSSVAFAGYDEAMELYYTSKKYVEAEAEFRKVLPTLEGEQASYVQLHIGHALYIQKKYAESIVEYQKVASIEGAKPTDISNAQLMIGNAFYIQNKYAEAIVEYQKVVNLEGANPSDVSNAQLQIGRALAAQGKTSEAQEAFVNGCLIEGAAIVHIKDCFNLIKKGDLGVEEYNNLLSGMILIIPATLENADFLGVLKSEQEKLK